MSFFTFALHFGIGTLKKHNEQSQYENKIT